MAKGEELWDDSALINAFDSAMSSYKKMHSRRSKDTSTDQTQESISASICSDADDSSKVASNAAMEFTEAKDPTVQDNHCLDSVEPEPHTHSSNGQNAEAINDYSREQNADDYNNLLTEYYDLEEKKQRILQQLQQFGGYDCQYPSQGFDSSQQWGTSWASQDHTVHTSKHVAYSCCPYACHCSAVPCTSFSTCCGTCDGNFVCNNSSIGIDPAKSFNSDIVKVAMGAAERAMTSLKTMSSDNAGAEERDKEKQKVNEEIAQSSRSETELSVVLNAWYSAGFYMGKYLTEQSMRKK